MVLRFPERFSVILKKEEESYSSANIEDFTKDQRWNDRKIRDFASKSFVSKKYVTKSYIDISKTLKPMPCCGSAKKLREKTFIKTYGCFGMTFNVGPLSSFNRFSANFDSSSVAPMPATLRRYARNLPLSMNLLLFEIL